MPLTKKEKTPAKAAAAAPEKKASPVKKAATKKITLKKAAAPKAAKAPKTPKIAAKKEKPGFESILSDIKTRAEGFDAGSYQGFLAIQVTLTDLGKVFYAEVKDGKLSIEPYEYNDRQANIIMTSANFIKMIDGKLNKVLAFTTGKLKVEGDLGKAQELSTLLGG